MVKSVVKTFCRCFFGKGNTRKSQYLQGFSCIWKIKKQKPPACSQTSRATSCATPRLVKIFDFLGQIRKWSNLWSKVFCRRTRRRKSEKNGDFASFRRSAHEAVTRSQAGALLTALHPVCGWLLLQINSEQSILYLICAAKSIGAEDFFKLCITKKTTNVTLRSESPRYSLKSRSCETAYPRRWTACEPF